MALIRASYTVHRGQAYVGQIADTSLYNIDGACAADGSVPIGIPVAVQSVQPIEGHKVVKLAVDNSLPILGVAIMSHAYSPTGAYDDGVAVNVMTHGRVWVKASNDLTEAQAAYDKVVSFDADGVVTDGGAVKTGYKFTGEILQGEHAPGEQPFKLVKIQVLQSVAIPAESAPPSGGGE